MDCLLLTAAGCGPHNVCMASRRMHVCTDAEQRMQCGGLQTHPSRSAQLQMPAGLLLYTDEAAAAGVRLVKQAMSNQD